MPEPYGRFYTDEPSSGFFSYLAARQAQAMPAMPEVPPSGSWIILEGMSCVTARGGREGLVCVSPCGVPEFYSVPAHFIRGRWRYAG